MKNWIKLQNEEHKQIEARSIDHKSSQKQSNNNNTNMINTTDKNRRFYSNGTYSSYTDNCANFSWQDFKLSCKTKSQHWRKMILTVLLQLEQKDVNQVGSHLTLHYKNSKAFTLVEEHGGRSKDLR